MIPQTPRKKAKIIENLANSPNTSAILMKKGVLMSPKARKSLKIGEAVMTNIKAHMQQVKPNGGIHAEKL